MITSDNSITGEIRIASFTHIDFALWTLLKDGIHVPPFDKHSGGNQILQSVGMTQESWWKWLKFLLIQHDNRLSWHVPNIEAQVEESLESFKQVIGMMSESHNIILEQQDYATHRQRYNEQLINQEKGYKQALTDYQGLNISFIKQNEPPLLYQDNYQVKKKLISLWNDYHSSKPFNDFIYSTIVNPIMWDVQKNPPTDKYREMYLVDYPFEVEIFIPPIFAIVTVPNRPVAQAHLEQRMFSIIQNSET